MQNLSLSTVKNAFVYSMSGLKYLLKERAFLQELCLGALLLCAEFFRNTLPLMQIYLFSSYILVLITETLNTSIETSINRISLEKHELSKKTKDLASTAVFIALLHLGIIWILSCFFQK